jgi:signal transduction histidine kinase
MNEGKTLGGDTGRLVGDQASLMRAQVEHYLQRARIAAQADTLVFRTDVEKTAQNLVRVMRKLNAELTFDVKRGGERIVFNGEKGDLEEILGNLLENAGKWARTRVRVSILSDASDGTRFCLLVEDDGPGIPEEQRSQALRRGTRLDETKPGTGLGLSIVTDLVAEYGGTVALDQSRLGGLKVVTRLPRTRDQMRDNQDKR